MKKTSLISGKLFWVHEGRVKTTKYHNTHLFITYLKEETLVLLKIRQIKSFLKEGGGGIKKDKAKKNDTPS